MAIDVNGIYGRWPVRTPGIWEPGEYLRKMDRFGIERALIVSTAALLDDTVSGNTQVAEVCRRFPERFVGACVVSPTADPEGAASAARHRIDEGFRAIRLYPGPHRYSPGDHEVLDPVMREAQRAGVPVIVTLRISGSTPFAETPLSGVRSLAGRHPEVAVIVSGATYAERLPLTRIAAACPNLYVEISHMHGSEAVRVLCESVGADQVLFGTGMGVLYASPAVRKVMGAEIQDGQRSQVLEGNARRLLGL